MKQTNETLKEWKKEKKREQKRREDPIEMRRREFDGESQKCSICRKKLEGIGFWFGKVENRKKDESFSCKSCRFVDLCQDCKDEHEHEEDLVKLLFDENLRSYTCDECDLTIRGYRYKCVSCVDYDLCEDCVGKKHLHHRLLRITRSAVWREKQPRTPLENDPFYRLFSNLQNSNRQRNRQEVNECRQQ